MPPKRRDSIKKGQGESRSSAYGDAQHSSYLFKKGSKAPKRYQKRFFELNGHYLNYYADETRLTLKGTLDLNDCIGLSNDNLLLDLKLESVGQKWYCLHDWQLIDHFSRRA
jgi:hypothetical protein